MEGNERGRVTAIENGLLRISMVRSEACAKCRACVAGMAAKEMIMLAKNECGAKLGDIVRVELDGGAFLISSFIMYGIPLAFMLFGFAAGYLLHNIFAYINTELLSFLMGITFLLLGYWLIKRSENRFKKPRFEPKAVEVVGKFEELLYEEEKR